ncbi:MAG: AI-2E family transporter [Gemmatimonadota bacterium]|nr:AI-2E family transporter [Gemmatimonadota bacterium]
MTPPRDTKRKPTTHNSPSGASWRSADILRAASIVAGLFIILKLLWFANQIVIVAFLGTLFGIAVAAGVDRLARYKVNRGLGAAIVVISFLAILYTLGSFVAPTIADQGRQLREQLPNAVERAEKWLRTEHPAMMSSLMGSDSTQGAAPADSTAAPSKATDTKGATGATGGVKTGAQDTTATARATVSDTTKQGHDAGPSSSLRANIERRVFGAAHYLFPFLTSTVEMLAGLLLILMMSLYIGADPDTYRNGILHLFPKRKRKRIAEVLSAMASMLRKWLATQLIAMLVIGVVSTIALLLLGVKAAFALGIIAGLLEFVPTIGPVLSAVPAIAMGFLDSPEKALYVGLAYLVIQQLEGHLLIPLLMKGGMNLPPVLTIVTQGLMALLFGFLGLMIAVPLLAAVMVPIKMLYVEDALGDDIGVDDDGDDGPMRDG